MDVQQSLKQINEQLEMHCKKGNISILPDVIAVTKYVTIERAKDAYNAGIRQFGENRLEGFQQKKSALPDDVTMHFIGSLQTRKVKDVINEIDYFHALDRLSLAKEINKRAQQPIRCFLQVNVSGEASKHGIALEEVQTFIKDVQQYENITIIGLMTMAPFTDDRESIQQQFEALRNARDDIQAQGFAHAPCTELSMGMSNDYDIATASGSTFVRIGTKLVGKEE